MTATDRLNEIEARANAATEGPWIVAIYKNECKVETKRERWHVASYASPEDAAFIAHARTDVPALVAALRAVLDLHRESRNDVDHTPPCEHCHGEPGVHECGCWADEKWPTVCAVCMEGTKGASVAWPCPTVRAIEEALNA